MSALTGAGAFPPVSHEAAIREAAGLVQRLSVIMDAELAHAGQADHPLTVTHITVHTLLNPLTGAEIERHASTVRRLLASLNREIVNAALIGHGEPDFLDRERQEMNCGREFPNVRVPVVLERGSFSGCDLTLGNGCGHEFSACGAHTVSPSVGSTTVEEAGR